MANKKARATTPKHSQNPPNDNRTFRERRPIFYWILIIIKNILIFGGGVVVGFLFTDKGLYFAHSGIFHKIGDHQITTFVYIDFDDITKKYPINGTYQDQVLTVKNRWIDEVWVKTEVTYKSDKDGLKIECEVDKTKEPCEKYHIDPKQSVVLKLIIRTGTYKTNSYPNVCFKTYELENEDNYYENCIDLEIQRYR